MSAAAPLASAPAGPAPVRPAVAVPTAGASTPTPRSGTIRDRGSARHESVRATRWFSSGIAKVLGNVDVLQGRVQGLTSIAGALTAGAFRADGTFETQGPVEVRENLAVDGTVRFGALVRARDLVSTGSLWSASELRVDRVFTAAGRVEAPSARVGAMFLRGSIALAGDLEARGLVRAEFRDDSQIGTIRAAKVVLHGPPKGLVPELIRSVFGGAAAVRVDRIEADSVELAAVDVGFVHAREVTLGAGAHVTTVEGVIVKRHPSARVGFESRSPPPHGLHR